MDPIRDSLGENLWVIDHEEPVVLTIRHIRGRLLAINQELKRRMAQHQTAPTPADIIDLTNDDSKVNLYSLLVVDLCAGFFRNGPYPFDSALTVNKPHKKSLLLLCT